MITIGLTGSIGMGKSTVARMFEAAGVPLFDADAVVRRLQADDADLIRAIGTRFPDTVRQGKLAREVLAERVLSAPDELLALEAIVHPAVQAERARFLSNQAQSPALLFDIPLLFETGAADQFDIVVAVSAPPEVQRRRVLARPGMTPERLDAILARQIPDSEKRRRANFVIDNGGELSTTERQVHDILTCLGLEAKR